jgi:hypothetical protein
MLESSKKYHIFSLDGIEVSIEGRKGFINCVIRRDKAIRIYWYELVEKEMLDELNIPNEVRGGMNPTEMVVSLKDQTRTRLPEVINDLMLT